MTKSFWETRKRPHYRKPSGSHKRKTKQGSAVETLEDVGAMVRAQNYFYLRDQAVHPAVLASMQLHYVMRLIDSGILYRALDIETNEPYVSRNRWQDYEG